MSKYFSRLHYNYVGVSKYFSRFHCTSSQLFCLLPSLPQSRHGREGLESVLAHEPGQRLVVRQPHVVMAIVVVGRPVELLQPRAVRQTARLCVGVQCNSGIGMWKYSTKVCKIMTLVQYLHGF